MKSTSPRAIDVTQTPPSVPLLDLRRQHAPLRDEVAAALLKVYDSGAFVLGPEVQELERNVAAYCQARHAIGCASGSNALLLALMAHEVGPGDEVILPSFTFFATARRRSPVGGPAGFRRHRSGNITNRQVH